MFVLPNPNRQLLPFGEVVGVDRTTAHAVQRLQERWPDKPAVDTAGKALLRLEKMMGASFLVKLKEDRALRKAMLHNFHMAEFRAFIPGGKDPSFYDELPPHAWILVIHGGNRLVTVHRNNSLEWAFMEN